ncbi:MULTISPECIES: hypothetical protein [Dietzia]|uniref:hypothetical protein n=1 Tax=Dietzia TaxID=37914 RepID=UPI0013D800E3|nr:hypothetical protein [Dietzia sp. Alg238-R159]
MGTALLAASGAILSALAALGPIAAPIVGAGLAAGPLATVGTAAAALAGTGSAAGGSAALGAGAGAIGANPHAATGVQNGLNDAWNNAVSGSADAINNANIPGVPPIVIN